MALSSRSIVEAIRRVGVGAGDIVNLHSRLFTVGLPREAASAAEVPGIYRQAFQEVLTDRGTLVVPTYTTSFGHVGKPFIYEESPSEMGALSEAIRTTPGALRTLHPIQSLAALGLRAAELAGDHPPWNVGHDSIWDRMLRRRAKIVTLGIPPRQCMSFVHHVEFLACVPYVYHKLLRGEVYQGGVRVRHDFFIAVRYLQCGVSYNLSRLERDLEREGTIRRCPLGEDWVYALTMEAVFEVCMRGLRKDPYYLLERTPSFVEGEIPLDGTTRGRAVVPSYYTVLP